MSALAAPTTSAAELFAISQGGTCTGDLRCHWCGSPAERKWPHDDAPPIICVPRNQFARCPGDIYICTGCWLWRRKRVTAPFLGGGFRDGRCAEDHSWYVTDSGAWAIETPQCRSALYKKLMKPPLRFCLAFLDGTGLKNRLQLCVANDQCVIEAGTPLAYTLNGRVLHYTTYELGEAIHNGPEGTDGGVQTLLRLLGPYTNGKAKTSEIADAPKRGRGRPPARHLEGARDTVAKVVAASGITV